MGRAGGSAGHRFWLEPARTRQATSRPSIEVGPGSMLVQRSSAIGQGVETAPEGGLPGRVRRRQVDRQQPRGRRPVGWPR